MDDLSQLPFFRKFSPELRQAMMAVGEVKTYHAGDTIFESGDNDTDFYMLISGRIRNSKLSRGGQKRILRTVQPGDTFALPSLFDHKPMFITAEVLGEAKVFIIPHEEFMSLMKKYYELARFVIDGLVARLRKYGTAYTTMAVYSVDQRFISYLLDLMDSGESKKDEVRLSDSITTLAETMGTAREVLSREISKMVKKGWIEKNGQVVRILNKSALSARLSDA